MFNAWCKSQDEHARQNDGTLSESDKQQYINNANSIFTNILASEKNIKDAFFSRESILLDSIRISKDQLNKIKLNELLQTNGVTYDSRALNDNLGMSVLDQLVCDAAIWEAINRCGINNTLVCHGSNDDLLNQTEAYNKFIVELRETLTKQYRNLDNPLEKFSQDDQLNLYLYLCLNATLMFVATVTMVYGAFMSFPCWLIGVFSAVVTICIHKYLTEEIEKCHSNGMYKV